MGGAVVVRVCPLLQTKKYRVGGVAVLDVVEGKCNIVAHILALRLFARICAGSPSYDANDPQLAPKRLR
jgi:hypothetical protein